MFRRNLGRTHGQLIRSELSDSFGHLRLAAAHAVAGRAALVAGRVADQVEPVVAGARSIARQGRRSGTGKLKRLAPKRWRDTARDSDRGVTRMTVRRWSMVVGGLVAAGAAAGVATVLVRRRSQADAGPETGPETGTGTGPETGTGTGPETGTEAGPEKGTDTGPETGMGTGPVAGPVAGERPAPDARERTSDLIGFRKTG